MPRSTRPLRYTQQYQINPNFTQKKYYYENFKDGHKPFLYTVSATGIPAVATTAAGQGVVFEMASGYGFPWQVFNTTDQAVLPFATAASGLDIACDLVDNEAVELVPGGNFANSRLAFTVGTDSDFFFKTKWKISDASGSDQFLVGFRKQEAFAVPTSFLAAGDGIYTDFFGVGFAATAANPNPVNTASDLNNGGSTVVTSAGFTWADAKVHSLEVRVVGAKALVLINGNLLGNTISADADGGAITAQATLTGPVFTFDSGDVLVPFIFLRQDADVSQAHYLQEIEVGHLVDVGKDPNAE